MHKSYYQVVVQTTPPKFHANAMRTQILMIIAACALFHNFRSKFNENENCYV